jgi:Flp pilus assembly pilin Flp
MGLPDDVLHAIVNFLKEESGAPLMEYVLIGFLIVVVSGLFLLAFIKYT